KSYGVPGLRLGVLASGDSSLIARLKKDVAIWNINSFAEFYMQIYEKYHKDYDAACKAFIEERSLFYKELCELPFLKVFPSQANYFLCKLTGRFSSAGLARLLLKKNILIKDCGGKKAFNGGNYIRLAVRGRKDNAYLVETLKSL
ncbi:MAG: aminotransferase class I/II-fold pyridoxal phosphate-dependent enzyme, partial [Bacteroidales bacterium]|nr:aminotransferase class I/II-fold pyridoxal phosphate-dependent enzyme [Bacteroidales bacterium]